MTAVCRMTNCRIPCSGSAVCTHTPGSRRSRSASPLALGSCGVQLPFRSREPAQRLGWMRERRTFSESFLPPVSSASFGFGSGSSAEDHWAGGCSLPLPRPHGHLHLCPPAEQREPTQERHSPCFKLSPKYLPHICTLQHTRIVFVHIR